MLTKCPECELPVSDKAITCPHCGYPLKSPEKQKRSRQSSKRKRLPNGFGQISEIKHRNLRKPFRAMITTGKDDRGKPICKLLKPESYFETYNEAYAALIEYNRNPYDLAPSITMEELYDRWYAEFEKKVVPATCKHMKNAWRYCSSVASMRVIDVRQRHLKGCIETGKVIQDGEDHYPSANVRKNIKVLFNHLFDYAVEYELLEHNYSRNFDLSDETIKEVQTTKKPHIAFSEEEMEKLWDNLGKIDGVDILLIQCYSGWRPQELGRIKLADTDLERRTFIGGMKTEAGEGRVVPIHCKIFPLVEAQYKNAQNINSQYLLNAPERFNHKPLTYTRYLALFCSICEELKLNPDHRPHDGRKHFVTQAKKYKVDEYAIKYMVGHAISDITEKIYTERDPEWFKEEIEKIK